MTATLASIVAASAPLVIAVIGETISEKAGVVNLSLDGSMLLSAMAGFVIALETDSVTLGFAAAAAASMAVALLIAYASINLKLNQIAVGFVLFLLATDLSSFLGNSYVRVQGPAVTPRPIPGLSDIPFVGRVLFSHNLMVYFSLALIPVAYWFIYRTRRGLVLQAVGERPEAAHARGVAVNRLRYLYTAIGGALVGIAGAAYSLDVQLGWSHRKLAGLGWIALAIVIFGGWHPVRAAFGTYLFGALQVVALKLQPVFPGLAQVLPILPFPLMIFTLVVVNRPWLRRIADRHPGWRAVLMGEAPSGIGVPFDPE